MDFGPETRSRTRHDSIVPMINVVFLLLIFFLMNAQLTPPDPVRIETPVALGQQNDPADTTLFIAADGAVFLSDEPIELNRLPNTLPTNIAIKADAMVLAPVLAQTLRYVAERGATNVTLTVGGQK